MGLLLGTLVWVPFLWPELAGTLSKAGILPYTTYYIRLSALGT